MDLFSKQDWIIRNYLFDFFCLGIVFICLWFLPLPIWNFDSGNAATIVPLFGPNGVDEEVYPDYLTPHKKLRRLNTTQEQADKMKYHTTFKTALLANAKHLDIGRLRRVEVERYVPNPRRREFGILKIN